MCTRRARSATLHMSEIMARRSSSSITNVLQDITDDGALHLTGAVLVSGLPLAAHSGTLQGRRIPTGLAAERTRLRWLLAGGEFLQVTAVPGGTVTKP